MYIWAVLFFVCLFSVSPLLLIGLILCSRDREVENERVYTGWEAVECLDVPGVLCKTGVLHRDVDVLLLPL